MTLPMDVQNYSAFETLRNGKRIEIRASRPEDWDELKKAIARMSDGSLYSRFFGQKREFTEKEIDYYMNIDFVKQVALVAVLQEAGSPVIGAGRFIVSAPGSAEVAFAVVDAHQGQGITTLVLRHLIEIARNAGLDELHAEVLPGNLSMLKVFERSGLEVSKKRDPDSVKISIRLR
jgi:RimJ/RimL family protein N-acetyltransferase